MNDRTNEEEACLHLPGRETMWPRFLIITTVSLTVAVTLLGEPGSSGAAAQAVHPDFSGTWIVENVEVEAPPPGAQGSRGRSGPPFGRAGGARRAAQRPPRAGGRGPGGPFGVPYEHGDRVAIRQTEQGLIVTDDRQGLMSSYPFDGRETSNPGPGEAMVKTHTHWDGVGLVTESEWTPSGPRGDMTLKIRDVRSLDPDGTTLTLVRSAHTPFGTRRTTITFAKAGR